ncbi:hypothetical protein NDU88_008272 [Pleurodeles waltl]|uniref:B30.2/SPRY domain-containing protein n=1 Tax=Pleurodeles waltl TaxID=8319 RepID=A0AAV7SV68_PLEWA|nr:hypothetical protein NDU88_008272 [Pleurodeles waltl]
MFIHSPLSAALVILDPDPAHRDLTLSEDGRRVGWTDNPQIPPDNLNKFTASQCVLGWEGFTSGGHYWEVQLLQRGLVWAVGVARGSLRQKGVMRVSPEWGLWAVSWWWGADGRYRALTSPPTLLSPRQPPLKLGLYLDYEGGRLSLYNADTWEHLYTFNDSFTGGLRPFFWLDEDTVLRLV